MIVRWSTRVRKAKTVTADDLVSEAQVEETCTQWLALDGWIALVTDPKQLRGLGVTEPGIADKQYRRAGHCGLSDKQLIALFPAMTIYEIRAESDLMFVEWKRVRAGKATKTSVKQDAWHAKEKLRGFLTLRAGIDFQATIREFQEFYRQSGLMRRKI